MMTKTAFILANPSTPAAEVAENAAKAGLAISRNYVNKIRRNYKAQSKAPAAPTPRPAPRAKPLTKPLIDTKTERLTLVKKTVTPPDAIHDMEKRLVEFAFRLGGFDKLDAITKRLRRLTFSDLVS